MFTLDPAFEAASHPLGELTLCQARLQDDARFPWIVLIPRVVDAVALADLGTAQWAQLGLEIAAAGAATNAVAWVMGSPASRLNVGQLGNITPQLHIHVVARHPGDAAWPGPVWGHGQAQAYGSDRLEAAMAAARGALGL